MSTVFRQRRVHYGLPACLLGLVLVLASVLGPLSLYRCCMMGSISVRQHGCCETKRGKLLVQAERSRCCEQVKAASPAVPALTSISTSQLEPHWTPVLAVLFAQPVLEPARVLAVPPSERGPPVRPPAPPLFLLNASLLC